MGKGRRHNHKKNFAEKRREKQEVYLLIFRLNFYQNRSLVEVMSPISINNVFGLSTIYSRTIPARYNYFLCFISMLLILDSFTVTFENVLNVYIFI